MSAQQIAGVIDDAIYVKLLNKTINQVLQTPGRELQSVAQSSFDAWVKYYRQDENTANATVSYYTKGAVMGFLLDARIRGASGGAKSLDDVMRVAYQKFSGGRGYTPDEFRAVAEQVSGVNLKSFWADAVEGTAELDYTAAVDALGLHFRAAAPPSADRPAPAWLGMSTRNDAGRLVVTQVRRDTPAYAAGLNVDDEVIAIDDFRVRADQLTQRLDAYKPGDTVTLLVARRDQLLRLPITFGEEPPRRWRLDVNPTATAAQQQQRTRWLQPGA